MGGGTESGSELDLDVTSVYPDREGGGGGVSGGGVGGAAAVGPCCACSTDYPDHSERDTHNGTGAGTDAGADADLDATYNDHDMDGEIDEETLSRHMCTFGLPDPDLLIRTSGEYRISNFLLWQLAYAELFFVDKLWPEFTHTDLRVVLQEFYDRHRRFGL